MSAEGIVPERGTRETNIYSIEIRTGNIAKLTNSPTQKTLPIWSPDGTLLAYYSSEITTPFAQRGDGVFVIQRRGDGIARKITSNITNPITAYSWSSDGKDLIVSYRDGLRFPIASVEVGTAIVKPVGPGMGSRNVYLTTSRGGVVWGEQTDPNGSSSLWFRDSRSYKRIISELEPAADPRVSRHYEIRHWKNSRGEIIDGMLMYPLEYKSGNKYPLIVDTYGAGVMGNRTAVEQSNFVKAAPGYFIFRPNHRAPHMWVNPLKDTAYTSAAAGPNGIRLMTDDILSGVDQLIADGRVAEDRMCLFGFSNGGLEAEQVLSQTTRFKCAVIQSPSTSDWLNSFFVYFPEDTLHFMGDVTPWEDPATYVRQTPLFQADKITTPILLAVGDKETVVLATIEMYNALRFLKRDVTLLRYTTEGHGFSGSAEEDFTRRIAEFFQMHIGNMNGS
jgi:dipeptidyl aminopeptidase/acylaminoacyl peptidase